MATGKSLEELIAYYADIESLGASILTDKEQRKDLDKMRNSTREALRELKRADSSSKGLPSKSWLCFNGTFIKVDTNVSMDMLQADQKTIEEEVRTLDKEMKSKVSELERMEGTARMKGFNLKGISMSELSSISGKN